jgi:hypothetical protein
LVVLIWGLCSARIETSIKEIQEQSESQKMEVSVFLSLSPFARLFF